MLTCHKNELRPPFRMNSCHYCNYAISHQISSRLYRVARFCVILFIVFCPPEIWKRKHTHTEQTLRIEFAFAFKTRNWFEFYLPFSFQIQWHFSPGEPSLFDCIPTAGASGLQHFPQHGQGVVQVGAFLPHVLFIISILSISPLHNDGWPGLNIITQFTLFHRRAIECI